MIMSSRRDFLSASGALVGAALVSRAQAALIPEAPMQGSASTQAPLAPPNGRPYHPVVTLNGWT
ncbi:MAG: twin-arginine translocation signal domain-containing protein, partial [Rugosibacter sp.]